MYEYDCTVDRVVDGDSLDLVIDVGFYATIRVRVRVLGVDTPELRSRDAEERAWALEAKNLVYDWTRNRKLRVRTQKADGFGRWLADIADAETGETLTEMLLAAGFPPYVRGR